MRACSYMRYVTLGKVTVFVANQNSMNALPDAECEALDKAAKTLAENNKALAADVKAASAGLFCPVPSRIYDTPPRLIVFRVGKGEERAHRRGGPKANHGSGSHRMQLFTFILSPSFTHPAARSQLEKLRAHLAPLREGAPRISAEQLQQLDLDWAKWRGQWLKRRKVFVTYASQFRSPCRASSSFVLLLKIWIVLGGSFPIQPYRLGPSRFWADVTGDRGRQDALDLADELGIEHDTAEHIALEKGPLCIPASKASARR